MSNQSYTNAEVPYWLARTGVDFVSFIKQAAPPFAWFDRGIVYELVDGILYYNGNPILTGGGPITVDSVTITQEAANPGGADTLWMHSPDGHLYHGSHDTENDDPTQLYVSTNGRTTAAGATGAMNDPVSTITDALTLWDASGTNLNVVGDYSGEAFTLPAQTVIKGDSCQSFRTLLGAVTAAGATWTGPPPFGFNQGMLCECTLQGLVDFQAGPMTAPLLSIASCTVLGGVTANDTDCDALLVMRDCDIGSLVNPINTNCEILNCSFGVAGLLTGDLQISHSAAADMRVFVSNTVTSPPGNVLINANSLANVLTVSLVGYAPYALINVNTVTALGGLVLIVDDISSITWGVGAQANTTLVHVKKAELVGYTPAVPGDWVVPPTQVAEALDALAATGSGDVTGPAGATDNALTRYDGVTGKLIQNSTVTLSDGGDLSGVTTLNGSAIPSTIGDVVGPGGSADNSVVRFDGATGKLVQGSNWLLADTGEVSLGPTKYITFPNPTTQTLGADAGNNLGLLDTANTAIGAQALMTAAGTASGNTCVGSSAGAVATTADNNTLIGRSAGGAITTGGSNTCIGANAGSALTTGINNLILGTAGTNTNNSVYLGDATMANCFVPGLPSTSYTNPASSPSLIVDQTNGQLIQTSPLWYAFTGNTENSTAISVGGQNYYNITGGGDGDASITSKRTTVTVNMAYTSFRVWATFGVSAAGTLTYQLYSGGAPLGTTRVLTVSSGNRVQSTASAQAGDMLTSGDLLSMSITASGAGIVITQMGWDCLFELIS